MTRHGQKREEQPAAPIGQPAGESDPQDQTDFAGEHNDTAVSEEIVTGEQEYREPESPRGWSGMES